jgi:hypothetical protein
MSSADSTINDKSSTDEKQLITFTNFVLGECRLSLQQNPSRLVLDTMSREKGRKYIQQLEDSYTLYMRADKQGIVEQGIVEQGIVEQGIVEQGIVEQGIVEQGIVEQGIVEQGIVEQGIVEKVNISDVIIQNVHSVADYPKLTSIAEDKLEFTFVAQILKNDIPVTRLITVKFEFWELTSEFKDSDNRIKTLYQGYDSKYDARYKLRLLQNPRQMILDLYTSCSHKKFVSTVRSLPCEYRYIPDEKDSVLIDIFMQEVCYGEIKVHLDYIDISQTMMVTSELEILTPRGIQTEKLIVTNLILMSDASSTHLTFGKYFNQPIDSMLPDNVTHLTFGEHFNPSSLLPIDRGVLPNNLTHLTFGEHFNPSSLLPIDRGVLPNNLTHLTFGEHFNQPIDRGVLPNNLTHLTFGEHFNQPIDRGVLPNSLTHLTFGKYYNQLIEKDVLPDSLTHLTFCFSYYHPIERSMLPDGLINLTFRCTDLSIN